MKITRLKRGYRINLSDSEYAALVHLIGLGQGDMEGMNESDWEYLGEDDDGKAIIRGWDATFSRIAPMVVTDDRRS